MTEDEEDAKARRLLDRARRSLDAGDRAAALRIANRAIPLAEGAPSLSVETAMLLANAGDAGRALDLLATLSLRDAEVNSRIAAIVPPILTHAVGVHHETEAFLARLVEAPGVSPESLFHAAVEFLKRKPELAPCWVAPEPSNDDDPRILALASQSPLLIAITGNAIAANAGMEDLLTASRRAAFSCFRRGDHRVLMDHAAWIIALARQNFLNEYCHAAPTEVETDAISRLDQTIQATECADPFLPVLAALRACYGPIKYASGLAHIAAARKNLKSEPDGFGALWREQVEEPEREVELATHIPAIGMISDTVSSAVRNQYEAAPYPRWSRSAFQAPRSMAEELRRQLPVLPKRYLADVAKTPEVLIAGGGTGQHPIPLATRIPSARFQVIDLSRASLAYAARKAEERGITNISFAQADILALDDWARRFDVIESMGVLHHMADPIAGWRILARLLKPGGWMKIGLYSHAARGFVRAARAHIAANSIPSSPEGIRAFRAEILSAGANHPLAALTRAYDFYSLSNCRDMFFHVQEHQFTIPQIAAAIDALDLDFMGFQLPDARGPIAYRARYPNDPGQRDLANWAAFEADQSGLFGAMYAFWLRKPVSQS